MIDFKTVIRQSADEWNADNAPRLSAALAYYALLSLSPVVIVLVGISGFFFGKAAAAGQLAWEIHRVVGWDGARAIQKIIQAASHKGAGIIATVLSLGMLVFGASSVVVELRSGLNMVWGIQRGPSNSNFKAVMRIAMDRFYSFILVTGAGIVLLLSLVATTWFTALGKLVGGRVPLPIPGAWLRFAALATTYVVVTLLFAAIYRVVPDIKLKWSDVMVGASVTALIYTAGKQLIGLYLAKAAFVSTYGAAGSFVVLLVWVYYSAQLFFLGAEFTKVYTRMYGSHRGRFRGRRNPDSSAGHGPVVRANIPAPSVDTQPELETKPRP